MLNSAAQVASNLQVADIGCAKLTFHFDFIREII